MEVGQSQASCRREAILRPLALLPVDRAAQAHFLPQARPSCRNNLQRLLPLLAPLAYLQVRAEQVQVQVVQVVQAVQAVQGVQVQVVQAVAQAHNSSTFSETTTRNLGSEILDNAITLR